MNSLSLARKSSFVITLGVMTGLAAVTVDMSLPAIPGMVDALATSLSRGQQIVGIFMAGLACGQIPAGLVSDRVGRLPVLYAGMGLFLLGAIVAATARNIDVMLIARFVQGLGAAASIVLSRAIVRDIASGKEAARLMSLMTMIFTIAPVIAPSIGALLVGLAGWRAPFIAIALVGSVMLAAIRLNIVETHRPGPNVHPVRQLRASFAEFFSHRQSIYGLLLLIVPPAGFMSIIAVSAALVVEIYGFSVTAYGIIFAGLGTSILIGSFVNRWLVARFDAMQLIGIGASLMGFSSLQLLTMAAFDTAPFIWLWGCACLFMFALALLLPNATVIALDPMPRIAGVASSILGTTQNLAGAGGAILGALIYEGTIRNSIVIMGASGTLTMLIFFSRSLIAPGPLVHNPDELARE